MYVLHTQERKRNVLNKVCVLFYGIQNFPICFFLLQISRSLGMTASILQDTSGESSSFCANTIKLENSGAYYCNSYASPIPSAPPPCIVSVGSINERSPNSSSMVVSSANSELFVDLFRL